MDTEVCAFDTHEWVEGYYGHDCQICGGFIPYGNEPWAEQPDPEACHYCGKEFEDFSDLGCEHCDARHPHYGVIYD
jgi:hypothetical protein